MNNDLKNDRRTFLTFFMGFSQIYAWATTYYIPATLTKIISTELNQSYLTIVGGFSWALLMGGLSAPKIGAWIDKEGGRIPLCLGSILMGIGLLILSQTQGLVIWYLGWSIVGLGMALGLFNAVFAAIGRLFGQDAKKIIIRITLISGFATLFWPITTYLIESWGWRYMLIMYGMIHIIVWAPLYFFSLPRLIPLKSEDSATDQLVTADKIKIVFYLLAIYAVLRSIVGTMVSVNIIALFEGLGLAIGASAVVAALIGPSQIAGRLLEMFLGRKIDPIYSSLFWTAVLPLAIFMLIIFGSSLSPLFAIAYGMSNGVLTITMGILPMILFGSKGYATLLGKIALPVLIAQAATPLIFAPLMEHWSARNVLLLAAVLSVAALLCLIILPLITKRSTKQRIQNAPSTF